LDAARQPAPRPNGPPVMFAGLTVAGRFFRAAQDHQSLPDLVLLPDQATRAGIDSGFLVPVQTCLDATHADMSGFVPAASHEARLAGVQWGLPVSLGGAIAVYNTQALARAGLDPTHLPTTLAAFVRDARALREHSLAAPIGPGLSLFDLLRTSGVAFVDHDDGQSGTPTHAALDTPTARAVIDAVRQLVDGNLLAQLGPPTPGAPGPGFVATANGSIPIALINVQALSYLAAGRVPIGPGRTAPITFNPNVTLGVGPVPTLTGPGAIDAWSDYWFLCAHSAAAQRTAAWTFLTWFEQPAQQARYALATGSFPDQRASATDPAFAALLARSPLLRQAWTVITTSPSVPQDLIGPWGPVGQAIGNLFGDLQHGATTDSAIATASASVDRWLKIYNSNMADWDRHYGLAPRP
ncbi:MAG: extracellular solute-binding protein, partial [Acidimicrobiales bacterium]